MKKRLFACSAIKISRQHTCAKDFVKANKKGVVFCHFSLSVTNCTFLTVDPGGSLCMSSCDNHYGAKRKVYKVKGYFCHFSLSVINCTTPTVDPGGPLRMGSCDNHYGAQCNFSCAIGYRLNGSSTESRVLPLAIDILECGTIQYPHVKVN